MKIFTKKKIKTKFKKKFLFYIIIIFFLGISFERFDTKNLLIKKSTFFFYEMLNNFSSSVFSKIYNIEKIKIDVSYKNYNKILKTRNISLSEGRATENIHKWVPADLNFNKKNYKSKIKLKGVHADHWNHPTKWSFSIKLKDNNSMLGLKRFSIQQPVIRDYLYEWMFMRALKKEKIIAHRSNYYQIIFNGNDLGLYYLEEVYSKQLIESNKRREGPIIALNKDLWVKEANNLKNLGINKLSDSFWRAKIEPIRFDKDQTEKDQELLLHEAINKFEIFRNDPSKINEVFDTKQLSTALALKTLFGAYEFDWKDIKFYYNPITKLLEPVIRELHLGTQKNFVINWWSGDVFENENFKDDQNTFLKLLFQDIIFYETYLTELNRLIKKNYIRELADENKKEFNRNLKILKIYYPTSDVFSFDHLNAVKKNIKNVLNPTQSLNVYYLKYKNNYLYFNVQNLQHLPIKINNLNFNDELFLEVPPNTIIEGYQSKKPAQNYTLKVYCDNINYCNERLFDNTKIYFNILGQDNEKNVEISRFYSLVDQKKKDYLLKTFKKNNFKNNPLLTTDHKKKKISFSAKKVLINEEIIIPEGYNLNIEAGSKIIFSEKGKLITYSAINFNGTEEDPILVSSANVIAKYNKDINQNITIIDVQEKSVINNTAFKNLYGPLVNSGNGITGVINVYNSNIIIKNSIFDTNFQSDDFLNIINSKFEISDTIFRNSHLDSIDIDFSNGSIDNTNIYNSGNDAFDFSGSKIKLNNISGENIGDKFVSVGEGSTIYIENLSVRNVNIGIASKDLSNLEVKNLEMMNGKIAVAAYQKKNEYGAAKIKLKNSKIENFEHVFLSEKGSSINSEGTIVENSNYDYGKL